MLRRKFQVARLELTRRLIGKNRRTPIRIKGGPLKGKVWSYGGDSNNTYILGNYEIELINLLTPFLKVGDVVVDCGAHEGYFSLIIQSRVGNTGQVHCIEAMPSNCDILQRNLSLNSADNIFLHRTAIGNEIGTVEFSASPNSYANTYMTSSVVHAKHPHIEVPISTLDRLCDLGEIPTPDFIKIDIEGAEYEALLGMKNVLQQAHPTLHLATHDIHYPGVRQKSLNLLIELGYQLIHEIPHPQLGGLSGLILVHPSRL